MNGSLKNSHNNTRNGFGLGKEQAANNVAKTHNHNLNSSSGQTINGIVPISGAHSDLEIRGTTKGAASSHSVGKLGHKDYITQKFINQNKYSKQSLQGYFDKIQIEKEKD